MAFWRDNQRDSLLGNEALGIARLMYRRDGALHTKPVRTLDKVASLF